MPASESDASDRDAQAHERATLGAGDVTHGGDTQPWAPHVTDPLGDTRAKDGIRPGRSADLSPGATVGRYVLEERIGAGGMGVVYAAHDPELDRRVAVKLVRATAAEGPRSQRSGRSSGGASRLLREAQAMARLHHPNVIVVHDVGTVRVPSRDAHDSAPMQGDSAALVFIAMEYLGGGTLRDWLELRRRPWAEVLDRFTRAGAGLQAAHAAGIVHRDFKPENVLLGDDGRVCVVDFGLARAMGSAMDATTPESVETGSLGVRLTQTGAVMGTPAYMAPEQHEGSATDAKTDQFSFCVALWEALYGQRPFAGDSVATLAFNVLGGELRPPPAGHGVPRWIQPIVARGLAVDPASRWPTMQALLAKLARDPRAARRRRWGMGAAAVVGLGGATAVFVLATPQAAVCDGGEARVAEVWNGDVRERIATVMTAAGGQAAAAAGDVEARLGAYASEWSAMHRDACAATRIRGEQSEDLLDRRMVCLEQRRRELATVVQLLSGAEPDVAAKAARLVADLDSVADCGDAEALLERVQVPDDADRERILAARQKLHEVKTLRTALRSADAAKILEELAPEVEALGFGPLRAEYLYLSAATAVDQRELEKAEKLLYDAAILAAEIHEEEVAANAWTGLVRLIGIHQGRFGEVDPIIKAAEAAVARVREPDYYRGALLSTSGSIAILDERYADAEPLLREGHELLARTQGPEHDNTLETREMLAVSLQGQERLDEAAEILEEIVALRTEQLGADHPALAGAVGNLGLIYSGRGDHAKALELYLRCHELLVRGYGAEHQAVVTSQLNIASAMRRLGDAEGAKARLDAALELGTRIFGADNLRVGGVHLALKEVHAMRGDWNAALASAEEAGRVYEKTYGATHGRVADALVGQGVALLEAGKAAEAVPRLERAETIRAAVADTSPGDRAGTKYELGRALWETGTGRERARALVQESRDLLAGLDRPGDLAEVEAWLAAH